MKTIVKQNIIAGSLIIFLSTFIIIPPTIRALMPKEEIPVVKDKIALLKCTKTKDNLIINTDTLYTNNKIIKTTINFILLNEKDIADENQNDSEEIIENELDKLNNEELELLKTDTLITFTKENFKTSTILLFDKDYSSDIINKYKKTLDILKKDLELDEYLCTTIK